MPNGTCNIFYFKYIAGMHTIKKLDAEMRKKLTPFFVNAHRVDFGIDSILEGQSGKNISVVVDDPENPGVVLFRYGTFGILSGDASHPAANALLQAIEMPCAIQPSPDAWMKLLQTKYSGHIKSIERFSFSHQQINLSGLKEIIANHPQGSAVQQIDKTLAGDMENQEWNKYHLLNYNSPEDFAQHGFGYGIIINGVVASACSAALRCARGIELNIITLPQFRNKGLASVVAAYAIIKAMEQNLIPHWDAANERSAKLAVRLGYKPVGSYHTHYISF
jgi:hypothetical protein